MHRVIGQRVLQPGATPIFVAVEGKPPETRPEGFRVLRVTVRDVTPTRGKGRQVRALACESLAVCCDGAGVEYVRAKLLEMAEALDGVVVVT